MAQPNKNPTSSTRLPDWYTTLTSGPLTRKPQSSTPIPNPPFFDPSASVYGRPSGGNNSRAALVSSSGSSALSEPSDPASEDNSSLKLKLAWNVAFAPAKSLPMNLIMAYMSGSSLQIFSVMMLFTLFKTPLQALATYLASALGVGSDSVFERYTTRENRLSMYLVKFVWVACQLASLGVGVWKIGQMGLLPTSRSDWLAWEDGGEVPESATLATGMW